jgi:hypothetical protein
MFTRANTLLPAAIIVGLLGGGALPALAGYNYDAPYGGPHQSWCDVNPNCNGWNKKLQGTAYQSNAGLAAPLNQPLHQKHHPSHKRGHDANDR